VEIGADLLIKATKVNGVYSADPLKDPEAVFYPRLTYNQALREDLKVMDATAIVLCRDNIPMRVMNIYEPGALLRLISGEDIGSWSRVGNEMIDDIKKDAAERMARAWRRCGTSWPRSGPVAPIPPCSTTSW
jgi:aspartokinase